MWTNDNQTPIMRLRKFLENGYTRIKKSSVLCLTKLPFLGRIRQTDERINERINSKNRVRGKVQLQKSKS